MRWPEFARRWPRPTRFQVYAVVLVRQGSVPKTSSGKVQRRACKKAFLSNSLRVLARSILKDSDSVELDVDEALEQLPHGSGARRANRSETLLVALTAEVLKVPVSQINPRRPINKLGLDSLTAMELQTRLEEVLDLDVQATSLMQGLSISQLATRLKQKKPKAKHSLDPDLKESALGAQPCQKGILSHNQQAMWLLHQMAGEATVCHISVAAEIHSAVDGSKLRTAFNVWLDRHPGLRTTYTVCDGQTQQQVQPFSELWFRETNAQHWDEARLEREMKIAANLPL